MLQRTSHLRQGGSPRYLTEPGKLLTSKSRQVFFLAMDACGCRFMAAWVREEENASNQRQKKRDAEEADKVEVAPGVTVASLRRFQTALIGPTQGLPKRRRLCH